MSDSCPICAAAADEQHLHDDGVWFAFSPADVPGWVMLGTRAHVEGMWSLAAEQAAGLGPLVRALGPAAPGPLPARPRGSTSPRRGPWSRASPSRGRRPG